MIDVVVAEKSQFTNKLSEDSMYFVPLTQLESVELLVHSLRAAAGEADCSMCPAYKVCMKQCLTIANSVDQMLQSGSLPFLGEEESAEEESFSMESDPQPEPPAPTSGGPRLKIVK
jgi:hypothetical protein